MSRYTIFRFFLKENRRGEKRNIYLYSGGKWLQPDIILYYNYHYTILSKLYILSIDNEVKIEFPYAYVFDRVLFWFFIFCIALRFILRVI